MSAPHATTRWFFWGPALALSAWAVVLSFVPLFDLLGYEFSLALTLLAAPLAATVGAGVAYRSGDGTRSGLLAALLGAALLLGPLLVITLNSLRVRNCDYLEGIGFFVVLPVGSSTYSAMLGAAAGQLLRGKPRSVRATLIASLLAGSLVWALWKLYAQPQLFAYSHIWGHFAGSIYDEALSIDARLLAFRGGTLLRMAAVGTVLWFWAKRRTRGLLPLALAAATALAAVGLYHHWVGKRVGYAADRQDIRAALSQRVERPGLVIHLPPRVSQETAAEIADDHAFRLRQLTQKLGAPYPAQPPIHSYVYRSAAQKARLMGGRSTMVAKPWLREIHIHGTYTPHDVMAHELAHVVMGRYGDPLLKVAARYGVLVNMALVEGVAEAVTPVRGQLGLHEWARALQKLDKQPDLLRLIGPAGFWSAAASRAYAVSGSFVQFLLHRYGAEPLQRAYANANFEAAYGRPLAQLVAAWKDYIQTIQLSDRELQLAAERFRVPSIFSRPCARELAQLRARARRARGSEKVALRRRILELTGSNPTAHLRLALAYRDAEQTEAFMQTANHLLEARPQALTPAQQARLLQPLGTLYWQRGEFARAKTAFTRVFEMRLSPASERLQWVRLWSLRQQPEARDFMRRFLTRELPRAAAVAGLLERLEGQQTPTFAYLLGRQLYNAGAYAPAIRYLQPAGQHPFAPIDAERTRLLATAHYKLDQWDEARRWFIALENDAPTSATRARARDWRARVEWQMSRATAPDG